MANNIKPIVAGTNPLATDVDQYRQVLSGIADVGQLSLCPAQNTPAVPTVTAGSTGNPNGAYYYKTVLITGWKQGDGSYYINGFVPSTDSSLISVTNSQIGLTTMALGSVGTIGRLIYRTLAGGAIGAEKYCGTIWDNVSTAFTDNIADASLGINMPNSSSTPAAHGTVIPSNVPTTNTTGTTFSVNPLVNNYGITSGINTYTVSISPAPTAYVDGLPVMFKVGSANTGPSTINMNGLGPKALVKNTNIPLALGDLLTGQIVYGEYDGTNVQITPDYSGQTFLVLDSIKGTIQVPTIVANQVTQILHQMAGVTIRSDMFAYTTNLITEARELITGSATIASDFAGKVAGSTVVNPNIAMHNSGGSQTTLIIPSAMPTEFSQAGGYNPLMSLDGTIATAWCPNTGAIAQELFSFNLIALYENANGTIPADGTIAGKVAWLKANITQLAINWYGFGSGPNGNKAYLKAFNIAGDSTWSTGVSNTSSSPTLLTYQYVPTYVINMIDATGFVYFLASTDASNGTIASTINTDYVQIQVTGTTFKSLILKYHLDTLQTEVI